MSQDTTVIRKLVLTFHDVPVNGPATGVVGLVTRLSRLTRPALAPRKLSGVLPDPSDSRLGSEEWRPPIG